jgi:AcrR family transcriptional regulator
VVKREAEQPLFVLPGVRAPLGPDRVLPLGRHKRRREDIREVQRARIIDAFVREVGDRGLPKALVPAVCKQAGVSAEIFYEIFQTKPACTRAAFTTGSEMVCDVGEIAFKQTVGPWEIRLHAAISAMFELLATSPAFARLAVIEMRRDVESGGGDHFNAVVSRCTESFRGTAESRVPAGIDIDADIFETVLVGAALGALEPAVRVGAAQLPELAKAVTYALALPAVGSERALGLLRQR